MSYRDQILGPLDLVRGVGGMLGLRIFTVKIRVRTWPNGDRIGLGNSVIVDTQLFNASTLGPQPVMVRPVSRKEILASGGLYTDRDVRVGPMTPNYVESVIQAAGGYSDATIDPTPTRVPTEIFWLVAGEGWPAPFGFADKISEEATALHYKVVLRSTGRTT